LGKFSEEPGYRECAGTIDYLIFTKFIPRPGWLIEKLIIELDGDPHGEYHKIQEDENRDK